MKRIILRKKFNQEKSKSYSDLTLLSGAIANQSAGYGAIKPKSSNDLEVLVKKRTEAIPSKVVGTSDVSGFSVKSSENRGIQLLGYSKEEVQPLRPHTKENLTKPPIFLSSSLPSLASKDFRLCKIVMRYIIVLLR